MNLVRGLYPLCGVLCGLLSHIISISLFISIGIHMVNITLIKDMYDIPINNLEFIICMEKVYEVVGTRGIKIEYYDWNRICSLLPLLAALGIPHTEKAVTGTDTTTDFHIVVCTNRISLFNLHDANGKLLHEHTW